MNPRVLNLGSLNVDHVYHVPHFVRPGETLAAASLALLPGGKGFNQSVALARAGATVVHGGRYGRGAAWLRDRLAQEGVDTSRLLAADVEAGHAVIQVDAAGQNSILLFGGANRAVTAADLPAFLAGAGPGDFFLAQNETAAVPEALALARERGLAVCFNPAPMGAEVRDYPLDAVDWLFVNETEAAELGGAEPLPALHARCPRAHVVLTLGANGVLCLPPGPGATPIRAAAPRVAAVDTTAAGDTFIGYFLAAVAAGRDLAPSLERACRAAALSVTRPGAADSIPLSRELD
jgi:ribokinase